MMDAAVLTLLPQTPTQQVKRAGQGEAVIDGADTGVFGEFAALLQEAQSDLGEAPKEAASEAVDEVYEISDDDGALLGDLTAQVATEPPEPDVLWHPGQPLALLQLPEQKAPTDEADLALAAEPLELQAEQGQAQAVQIAEVATVIAAEHQSAAAPMVAASPKADPRAALPSATIEDQVEQDQPIDLSADQTPEPKAQTAPALAVAAQVAVAAPVTVAAAQMGQTERPADELALPAQVSTAPQSAKPMTAPAEGQTTVLPAALIFAAVPPKAAQAQLGADIHSQIKAPQAEDGEAAMPALHPGAADPDKAMQAPLLAKALPIATQADAFTTQGAGFSLPEPDRLPQPKLAEAEATTFRAPPTPLAARVAEELKAVDLTEEGVIRVSLRPAGLGLIELELTRDLQDRLHLAVRVQNPMVYAAIRQDRSALEQLMANHSAHVQPSDFVQLSSDGENARQGQQAPQGQAGFANSDGNAGQSKSQRQPEQAQAERAAKGQGVAPQPEDTHSTISIDILI